MVDYEKGKELMGGSVPTYIPVNKPFRYVKICKIDKGWPCGGTHVKHIKELGEIIISKI